MGLLDRLVESFATRLSSYLPLGSFSDEAISLTMPIMRPATGVTHAMGGSYPQRSPTLWETG